MSTTRGFSIVGNSNVKRHFNPTNCRDRPLMSRSQLLPCSHLALLAESLRSVRLESNVVLMSCLTNFLTSAEEAGASLSLRIKPVLREAVEIICGRASESPEVFYTVPPPINRLSPLWYRDDLLEVMTKVVLRTSS